MRLPVTRHPRRDHFGFGANALAQGRVGGDRAAAGRGGQPGTQPPVAPVPLDNMEGLSWSFQPYPGGTGALLEKSYNEKGIAAFKRQPFAWNATTPGAFQLAPWGAAPLPAYDEDIAFLPVHRLSAAIKSGKYLSALRPTFRRASRYGGMVLAWSMDRVGPITRTAEDAALVFNVIHGSDTKDTGSITMPFHFNDNIDLATLRIAVRKQNAAAFDSYVQRKAKELNMDMAAELTAFGRQAGPGGGGGGGGGAPGATPNGAPNGGAPAGVSPASAAPTNNGQLNRWVPGRAPTAFEFINSQRRRQLLIAAWQDYLKDLDVYVGAADTGVHAQTGHPVAVVQMGFGVRAQQGGGRGDSTAAPPPPLNAQPICTQIAGNLYNDDLVLAVAHKYQKNTDWLSKRPNLG